MEDLAFKKIQTAYWYWFIHQSLLQDQIKDIKAELAKVESNILKGHKLKSNFAKLNRKFLRLKDKGLSISELKESLTHREKRNKKSFIGIYSGKDWDKYKKATRLPLEDSIEKINILVPGSFEAFYSGPNGLFKALKANNLREAVISITHEFFKATNLSQPNFKDDAAFLKLNDRLYVGLQFPTSYFAADNQFKLLTEALDHMFNLHVDEAEWLVLNKLRNGEMEAHHVDPIFAQQLRKITFDDDHQHPGYLTLSEVASFYISISFLRSKFLGDTRELSRMCFFRRYLKVLDDTYQLPQHFWFNTRKKDNSTILNEFQLALEIASDLYKVQIEERDIDLSELRDNNGTP